MISDISDLAKPSLKKKNEVVAQEGATHGRSKSFKIKRKDCLDAQALHRIQSASSLQCAELQISSVSMQLR